MRIQAERVGGAEIIHYASELGLVTSRANVIVCTLEGIGRLKFRIPHPDWRRVALPSRLLRRLLRLDKCNVVPIERNGNWEGLIVIRYGKAYHIDLVSKQVKETLTLRQSRNTLHQAVCVTNSGGIFWGEYGRNNERASVPVYRSGDGGRSWEVVFEFPPGKARHVHGCFWDPYEQKVWVCTGDFKGENWILRSSEGFEQVDWLGDGSQAWRTCHLLFTAETVYWGMDSPLETSCICRLDRKTGRMDKIHPLPGPVWYSKALADGWFLMATSVEKGLGVKDNHAHILASADGETWLEVHRVSKDRWRMPLFKNGVITFADGEQTSDRFYLSAEALSGIDGRAYRASLCDSDKGRNVECESNNDS